MPDGSRILLASVVDYAVIELGWAWRPMFAVGVIPSAALAIGMLFLPDTPRWLGSEGRWNEAGDVLERVAPREARSEMRIFPTRLRGYGSIMSATGNWAADLLVSISFLTLVASIGLSFTFWLLYGLFDLVSVVFIYLLAPETRAQPLEAIEEYWQNDRSWESASKANPESS